MPLAADAAALESADKPNNSVRADAEGDEEEPAGLAGDAGLATGDAGCSFFPVTKFKS